MPGVDQYPDEITRNELRYLTDPEYHAWCHIVSYLCWIIGNLRRLVHDEGGSNADLP